MDLNVLREIPPWVYWPAAVAGVLTAFAIIWRLGVVSLWRALWAAILAAPKIADGIQELGELIKGDVLARLEAGSQRFERNEVTLLEHQTSLDAHDLRLLTAEGLQIAHTTQFEVQTARLNAHELALAELRAAFTQHREEHGA